VSDVLAVSRRFVDLWYAPEERSELRALLADGYVHHSPSGDLDYEQFVEQLDYIAAALAEPQWDVVHAVADGDVGAVYVTFAGIHRDSFFGIPATGRRVTTAGACFVRVAGGRIAEDWDAWALQTILQQIS
jgi:steroid delta-isomerase-like uncharacterized protein